MEWYADHHAELGLVDGQQLYRPQHHSNTNTNQATAVTARDYRANGVSGGFHQ